MKDIFLFTHSYPYSKWAESFLETEVKIAATLDIRLTIVPLVIDKYERVLPSNVLLNTQLAKLSFKNKICLFVKMLFSSYFINILLQTDFRKKNFKMLADGVKYLYGAFVVSDFILKHVYLFGENTIFYSYWLNHTPLGFYMAKKKNSFLSKCKFCSRAHGYDLYDDRNVYIPFRQETISEIDNVFSISSLGASFLKTKYTDFAEKIKVSRLGVLAIKNREPERKSLCDISFVSCSGVYPLKRVDLILKSIAGFCESNTKCSVSWTHIGDGIDMSMLDELVYDYICRIPNLSVNLFGACSNVEVINLYSSQYFDLFINLSTSEGIPVSIMEAISFGIPVVATNVGGNCEIVTSDTGCLLPLNFEQIDFNNAVKCLLAKRDILRNSTYSFFQRHYDAKNNYVDFYNQI